MKKFKSKASSDMMFTAQQEAYLVDLLIRYPQVLSRVVDLWRQVEFYREVRLFASREDSLLTDALYTHFHALKAGGSELQLWYVFPNNPAELSGLLTHYTQTYATEFIDGGTLVAQAVQRYYNPNGDISTLGYQHLQAYWRPFLISKIKKHMAARIVNNDPVDEEAITRLVSNLRTGDEAVVVQSSKELYDDAVEESIVQVPTGYIPLDTTLEGGFDRSAMVLLFGNNGSGKTTIANQFAVNMAKDFYKPRNEFVLYVSSEQPTKQHFQSAASYWTRMPKRFVKQHLQNPHTLNKHLAQIAHDDRVKTLKERLEEFRELTKASLFYVKFPSKGSVKLADWLGPVIEKHQQKLGQKVGAVFGDWFGRTMVGNPPEAELTGAMNTEMSRIQSLMGSEDGFNALMIMLAQAITTSYGKPSIGADAIGNAKNITDFCTDVIGITTIANPPVDDQGELLDGGRKRYKTTQALNIIKCRFGDPTDVLFDRNYNLSRIDPVIKKY